MVVEQRKPNGAEKPDAEKSQPAAPTSSLPKGGGAIRGIGEKFIANPVTGTGSMTVPIATSPGRSGFGPQLSLSYDSSAGNGPFGFGWSLSLPAITRKTDKGLPKYQDGDESDVFILSGAEDLVPMFRQDPDGTWVRNAQGNFVFDEVPRDGYIVRRYRPRIEGLFARIERWTHIQSGETHWRSISRDNITTLYGETAEGRITDPADPARIFTWLICKSYDDKGNAIIYEYEEENSDGVNRYQVHEKNRTTSSRSANRYLKRIKYGNRVSHLVQPDLLQADWMFETVFDYGEHDPNDPKPNDANEWLCRHDPFSSYRAGFEVRTYRLCQRVLMFHHFPNEEGVGQDCLVRSTDFIYKDIRNNPDDLKKGHLIASFIASIAQSGYKRRDVGGYLKKSLPPLEFEYSQADIDETVQQIDAESLENLPYGLDGSNYQWVDLDGEGISGILTEQADGWFYKRNLSPAHRIQENGTERIAAHLAPVERVATKPAATLVAGQTQLMDLAGDGQVDLVQLDGPVRGFYERIDDADWVTFRPFPHCPNLNTRDPNLRFIDLDGDGHTDILISEDKVFSWHASLAEQGFAPAARVHKSDDEEKGPCLVFADDTQSIYLADFSGDGLTDLVRIRNGEVCYWPNLGYGRFGAKVTMDDSPWFEPPDLFDQARVRLGDIDGSGTTDIFYLGRDGITIWRNLSGNSWTEPKRLSILPPTDSISSVTVVDLLGNGTACLVWSSPLPGYGGRHMRYIDLMGGQKPHLLTKVVNNLGAETQVHYSPSTKFYVADRFAGTTWITRLPFPVHVVERVETYDHVSRNRFVTRYAYHHGYFDGEEREFRGFGMVEQLDTEEYATLSANDEFPLGSNIDAASHVPAALTKTWFHTGAYLDGNRISTHFRDEYYHEGDTSSGEAGLSEAQIEVMLLPDTILPDGLTADEVREATRALKGSILRQEIYALDGSDAADRPYRVTERNYTIEVVQPRGFNRHAVFFPHARETADFHYERALYARGERQLADPRVSHGMTIDVDEYGNVLRSAAISYGRRYDDPDPRLTPADRAEQKRLHVTITLNAYTNAVVKADYYRVPLPCETRIYELIKVTPSANEPRVTNLFRVDELRALIDASGLPGFTIPYEDVQAVGATQLHPYRRLLGHTRTLYRSDDLGAAHGEALTLLPLGRIEALALPGESYGLAFTPGLLAQVFQRNQASLLPDPENVLSGVGSDRGGYVDVDANLHWWAPSGRIFYSTVAGDSPADELALARQHFFLSRRFQNPFGESMTVTYDAHDFLTVEMRDALGNIITAGERNPADNLIASGNDYRVLQPKMVMDPNRNRSAVVFDALGMVVGSAVMGKPEDNPQRGDSLEGFDADLTDAAIVAHIQDPLADSQRLLGRATTRLVYDLFAYQRSLGEAQQQAAVVCTLAREKHDADLADSKKTKIQQSFSYSDGFGREIQRKMQAEPGPVPRRDASGRIITVNGQPDMTAQDVIPRWVGSGWMVFNNKGKPVHQFEPFFTDTHRFEFDVQVGVSLILFYDPIDRVVATLHPNHTWEKVVFDAWRQDIWDVNDTVLIADPSNDLDVGDFFRRLPNANYLPTWHAQRQAGGLGVHQQGAARKAAVHATTPSVAQLDTLGRVFLTVAHNTLKYSDSLPANPPTEDFHRTRTVLDIKGNQREVIDAQERVVLRSDYDLLDNRIHQISMEGAERWMVNDVAGNSLRGWDSRGHKFTIEYDRLRRPARRFVTGTDAIHSDPRTLNRDVLFEKTDYGEGQQDDIAMNLRTRVFRQYDGAGVITSEAYDFKGNMLRSTRELAQDYQNVVDWSTAQPLGEVFSSSTTYDALNRLTTLSTPDHSVIRPTYNEANLLDALDANLRGERQDNEPVWTAFVTDIDYDAKGRRTLIRYGNSAETRYLYDPDTFRLIHLYTRRAAIFTEDCGGNPPPPFRAPAQPPKDQPCGLQNLHYTYDPAGNITHIRDDSQPTLYFRNRRVEPDNDYIYDAIYHLIEATGREHLGQIGDSDPLPPSPASYNDRPRVGLLHRGDGNAMGTYREQYLYDAVGNFREMVHRGSDPAHAGWRRTYIYNEGSLLEPVKQSNRLTRTTLNPNRNQPQNEDYAHDLHGNMTEMPQLHGMQWDFSDRLLMTQRQAASADDEDGRQRQGERTYYVYDTAGRRVRKVTELATGEVKDERIYLPGFEIYRRHGANTLVRETLHVMDDTRRIALVETKTDESGLLNRLRKMFKGPETLIRYQFGNHLGSASLELDGDGQIISYEEYTPYGSTSYQAVRSQTETPKRYRYTSKERDEESGLSYHGARYYASWLGRWTSCDPAGMVDGLNMYAFTRGNPVGNTDGSGMQADSDDFSDLRPVAEEVDKAGLAIGEKKSSGTELKELPSAQRRVQTTPVNARYEGNKGAARARRYWNSPRRNPTGLGKPQPGDEMGHLSAARHNATADIPNDIANDSTNIVAIPAKGENARVTNSNGSFRDTDFHAAQEDVLDEIQARNQVNKTPGTLDSSVAAQDALEEARIKSAPFTREYSDRVEAGGQAKLEPGPPVDPSTGRVIVADTEVIAETAKTAVTAPTLAEKAAVYGVRVLEIGGSALKIAGSILTIYGAANEAEKTYKAVEPGLFNKPAAAIFTFAGAIPAGFLDDALVAYSAWATGGAATPVLLESWDTEGAGPLQHQVGEFVRWVDQLFPPTR